jgi:hypothetical protein
MIATATLPSACNARSAANPFEFERMLAQIDARAGDSESPVAHTISWRTNVADFFDYTISVGSWVFAIIVSPLLLGAAIAWGVVTRKPRAQAEARFTKPVR